MGGADDHEAAVGGQVVDAVGDGDAVGLGAEVVVVDGVRGSFPSRAVILEVANQFTLFGIDADDRRPRSANRRRWAAMLELFVAVGTGASRDALVIDAQPVAEVLEDAGHGPGTDLDAESGQFSSDLLSGAARPADTGNGIAGDIVLECRFDGGDHLGAFFFHRVAPTTGAADPLALDVAGQQLLAPPGTVPASRPSSSAMRRSPPWPILSDSSAA